MKLKFKNNKSGLSEAVSAVIIIALVLTAIGVIWIVINNLVSNTQENIQAGLSKISLEIQKDRVSKISDDKIKIKVNRNVGEGNLTGIEFIATDGSKEEQIIEQTKINELEAETFTISLTKFSAENTKEISIAPVSTSKSGKQIIGKIQDTYVFSGKEEISTEQPEEQPQEPPGCVPDSSCASEKCMRQTCEDECGNVYSGIMSVCADYSNQEDCSSNKCSFQNCNWDLDLKKCIFGFKENYVLLMHFENNLIDSSGKNNNGASNGINFAKDSKIGDYSAIFSGANSVSVQNSPSINFAGKSISLSVLIKIQQNPSGYQNIIGKETQNSGYLINYNNKDGGQTWCFRINGWANPSSRSCISSDLSLNSWHHIAGVYDGSKILIYIDGTLQKSESYSSSISTNSNSLLIGNNFKGQIDEAILINKALSADEVKSLYDSYQ